MAYTDIAKPTSTTYTQVSRTAVSGPNPPGTMVDDTTVGTRTWASVNNAKVSDNLFSTVNMTLNSTSHYLKATNFGFAIPSTATIVGILVSIQDRRSANGGGGVKENAIKIVKSDGTFGTQNKSTGATLPFPKSSTSYGSKTDLWNETWAASDINNSLFGVGISVIEPGINGTSVTGVDFISITVYYNSTYTNISKPSSSNYTNISKPTTSYTNVAKPTTSNYTNISKPT